MNWTIRPATKDELSFLRAKIHAAPLLENIEPADCEVLVAVVDGVPVGVCCARLAWQVEPLHMFPEFADQLVATGRKNLLRRIVLGLARRMEERLRSKKGPRWWFAHILDESFARAAESFGCARIYRGGGIYAKELD